MQPATLAHLLVDSASTAPAIIAESPALTLTYQQVSDQTEQLAARIRGAGLQPGDIVALVLPNGPAFVIVVLALVRAGLVAAPLDPAYPTFELRTFLDDFQPRAVIADDTSSAAVL